MPGTIDELGRKWKAKYPGAYDDLDDADVGRKVKAKFPGAYDDFADAPAMTPAPSTAPVARSASDAPAPRRWYEYSPLEASEGIDEGIKKMARRTVYGGGNIIRRLTGGPQIIGTPEVQKAITTVGPWEGLGGALETGLEYLAGSGVASKGAATLAQLAGTGRYAPAVNFLGRAGLEAGAAAGVAGLQTGGDPEAMKEAATYAGVGTAGIGAVGAAVKPTAKWLERSARTQYGKVLNPTMKSTKHIARHETIPGMLERRVQAGTMEGLLTRTQGEVDKWGKKIEDAWSKVPQNTTLEVAPMLQAIDDSVAHASVGGVNLGPAADVMTGHASHMKDVLTKIAKPNPRTGALEVTVGDLRQTREFADSIAARAGAFEGKDLAEQSLAAIYETTGNAARGQLAQRYPHVAKLNEQYHYWKGADKVVNETIERRVGQERGLIKSIGNVAGGVVGTAAGGMIGGPGGAAVGGVIGGATTDVLQRLMTSPGWRTVSAVNKQRLSEALASGNMVAIEFWLRKIGASIGGTAAAAGASQRAQRPAEAR